MRNNERKGEVGARKVGTTTLISGRYNIVNQAWLREKAAQKDDPRHIFYLAMLSECTYEGYLAAVGKKEVVVESYKQGPISGRMEILYCRRRGWVVDSAD